MTEWPPTPHTKSVQSGKSITFVICASDPFTCCRRDPLVVCSRLLCGISGWSPWCSVWRTRGTHWFSGWCLNSDLRRVHTGGQLVVVKRLPLTAIFHSRFPLYTQRSHLVGSAQPATLVAGPSFAGRSGHDGGTLAATHLAAMPPAAPIEPQPTTTSSSRRGACAALEPTDTPTTDPRLTRACVRLSRRRDATRVEGAGEPVQQNNAQNHTLGLARGFGTTNTNPPSSHTRLTPSASARTASCRELRRRGRPAQWLCTSAVGPMERHTQWMHRESTLSKRLHALQA